MSEVDFVVIIGLPSYVVPRSKKIIVPASAVSRVIGRAGCNINAIREVTGAQVEMERLPTPGDRTVTIK